MYLYDSFSILKSVLTVPLTLGIAFEVVGMMMTSLCKTHWQLVLAQGFCVGIGSGMLAFTSAAVIPFYFTRRRMLAAGVVSTGSSVGELIYVEKQVDANMGLTSRGGVSPHDERTLQYRRFWMGCPDTSLCHVCRVVVEPGDVKTTYAKEEARAIVPGQLFA